MNQQVNRRLGSGFETVHAGRDMFFCSDPKYVAIDLQYGPDGAVYVIDWYDQQHCHNPNTETWDRSNGRIYRIQYAATYQPKKVDLGSLDDAHLVELHRHKNEWYVRTARRLLQERSAKRAVDSIAVSALAEMAGRDPDPFRRLRALWTLHAIGAFSESLARQALADANEYVRGWAIQLLTETQSAPPRMLSEFIRLANTEASPVVRLYLASAIQRVPEGPAWKLAEALAGHGEDSRDRNLPPLIWDGLAPRMSRQMDRAFAIAKRSRIPALTDWIYWFASTLEGDGLDRVVALLDKEKGETLRRRLAAVELALSARAPGCLRPGRTSQRDFMRAKTRASGARPSAWPQFWATFRCFHGSVRRLRTAEATRSRASTPLRCSVVRKTAGRFRCFSRCSTIPVFACQRFICWPVSIRRQSPRPCSNVLTAFSLPSAPRR